MRAGPPVRLASIGRCIYCDSAESLSVEHVVPAGLNGNLELLDASCPTCARITSGFESRVQNAIREVRAGLAMGNARRKTRPRTGRAFSVDESGETEHRVPLADHSLALPLPLFPAPGCTLSEQAQQTGIKVVGIQWVSYGSSPEALARRIGARTLRFKSTIHGVDFARMIAKIGYAYAAGMLGPEAFEEVCVLPAILGRSDDVGHWVGTYRTEELKAENPNLLHRVNLEVRDGVDYRQQPTRLAIVRVQLFANAPTPGYVVAVGRLRPGAQLPASSNKASEPFPNLPAQDRADS